jgi:hypothetical protein
MSSSDTTRVRIEVIGSKLEDHAAFFVALEKLLCEDGTWGREGTQRSGSVQEFLNEVRGGNFSDDVYNFDDRHSLCEASKVVSGYVLVTEFGENRYTQTVYYSGVAMDAESTELRRTPNLSAVRKAAKSIQLKDRRCTG